MKNANFIIIYWSTVNFLLLNIELICLLSKEITSIIFMECAFHQHRRALWSRSRHLWRQYDRQRRSGPMDRRILIRRSQQRQLQRDPTTWWQPHEQLFRRYPWWELSCHLARQRHQDQADPICGRPWWDIDHLGRAISRVKRLGRFRLIRGGLLLQSENRTSLFLYNY